MTNLGGGIVQHRGVPKPDFIEGDDGVEDVFDKDNEENRLKNSDNI